MVDRVMVFIDGSNLYHSLKSLQKGTGRTDIDFSKFVQKIVGGDRQLVRTYYYNAPIDQAREPTRYRKQQKFFEALRNIEYFELRLGRLVYGESGVPYEKGVDIRLCTDMLVHGFAKHYDVAILVSGDTDFADALQAVKDQGLHVESALLHPMGSNRLREVVDRVIRVDKKFLSDCWQ